MGVKREASPTALREAAAPHRGFLGALDRVLAGVLAGLRPSGKRYWLLVPVTGLIAGLVAVGYTRLLELLQKLFWGTPHDIWEGVRNAPPISRILIPTLAGGLVALLLPLLQRGKTAEGTSGLIESLALEKGKLPFGRTILSGLVSITAVGAGASLGREGAYMQTGAAFGSWLGRVFRLKEHHLKILLACGAAGGMAAAYNVPIGASVFAMEVLLGSFALELFGPIIICSVIATAVARTFIFTPLGSTSVYQIPPYTFQGWEIFLYLLLGICLGLVSVLFIRFFSGLDVLFGWLGRVNPVKPIIAMAALGFAGLYFPDLYGNGYSTVNLVLRPLDVSQLEDWELSLKVLLVLPALKMIFTALCRAGGIPGGLFTPSLFVGAVLGFSFGVGVQRVLPWHTSPPGAYGLIGMGAILAGTMQAPITAILLVFEMTQDYTVILPLMSACIASTLISHLLQHGSLFTEPLRRRGILLPETMAPTWLNQPRVEEFILPVAEVVQAAERFDKVVEKFLKSPLEQERLYVTDRDGAFLGAISLHEIKLFIRESANLDPVIAVDVLDASFPFVYASDPISRAVEILAETDAERLPVLDSPEKRKLLGSISKRQILSTYRMTNIARIAVD